jgi:hypothetical protein
MAQTSVNENLMPLWQFMSARPLSRWNVAKDFPFVALWESETRVFPYYSSIYKEKIVSAGDTNVDDFELHRLIRALTVLSTWSLLFYNKPCKLGVFPHN